MMKTSTKDYFDRIGYNKNPEISLNTLNELIYLHTTTIPFENLNPILKIPVAIDIESITNKIIKNSRGGYCYEQNTLFYHVLSTLGFKTKTLSARVVWNLPTETITSLTHMLLMVTIKGIDYLVDVGFGGQSLTSAVAFKLNQTQKTPHELVRISPYKSEYLLEVKINNE